jgi:MerR family transcriptional regulator/heat shock protein HspR
MAVEHIYFISMAARLLDMHPQTLRKYERLGLVRPTRTVGSMRVYSAEELDRLKLIKRLVEEDGVNLAGVQRLLDIAEDRQRLRRSCRRRPPGCRKAGRPEISASADQDLTVHESSKGSEFRGSALLLGRAE